MPSAPCPCAPPVRLALERRRSDFEWDARVTAFTGSCCCCCCCLHWIGAAAGGIVGMRMGWTAGEKKLGAPLQADAGRALRRGVVIGAVLSVLLLIAAFVIESRFGGPAHEIAEGYLIALAFVPPLAMIPVGVPVVLSAYRLRRRMLAAFRREIAKLPAREGTGASTSLYRAKLTPPPKTRDPLLEFSVFCRRCWNDLGETMHLATCPECDEPVDGAVISGPDYGVGVAWRAALMSFGVSTAGCIAGYALILLLSLVLS